MEWPNIPGSTLFLIIEAAAGLVNFAGLGRQELVMWELCYHAYQALLLGSVRSTSNQPGDYAPIY